MSHLQSNQEEADTKLLLHALDATASGATKINIYSPDTDVLVLCIRHYAELCENTTFVTIGSQKQKIIPLKPIAEVLGPSKTAALPGFHALSGADNTGCFAGKGKLTCWKVFHCASEEIISALAKLDTDEILSEQTMADIEWFVCQLYLPRTEIRKVKDLRWWTIQKKGRLSLKSSLPPNLPYTNLYCLFTTK